jgi:hypothetical protein
MLVLAAAVAALGCAAGASTALAKHRHLRSLGPRAEFKRSNCIPFLISAVDGSNGERCTPTMDDTQSFRGDAAIELGFLDQRKFKGYEFRHGEDPCVGTRTARLYRDEALVQTVASRSDGSFAFKTPFDADGFLTPWLPGGYRAVMAPVRRKAEVVKWKFAGRRFAPVRRLKVTCGGDSIGFGQPAWYCESGLDPPYTLRTSLTGPCGDDEEAL